MLFLSQLFFIVIIKGATMFDVYVIFHFSLWLKVGKLSIGLQLVRMRSVTKKMFFLFRHQKSIKLNECRGAINKHSSAK